MDGILEVSYIADYYKGVSPLAYLRLLFDDSLFAET